MGNLKKQVKKGNDCTKLEPRKDEKAEKKEANHSLRLVEVSDDELQRLRIDVYPYLM